MIRNFEVMVDGWADGTYRRRGDVIAMDEAAAKWLVLNGQIKERTAAAPMSTPTSRSDGEDDAPGAAKLGKKERLS